MTGYWLSRIRLRRDASVAALAPLLLPDNENDRIATGHRLIWSLFAAQGPTATRNFLWRDDQNGNFYTLSAFLPALDHALLEVDTPKAFVPSLAVGDRLRFSLRANPTVSRPSDQFRTAIRSASEKPSRKTVHHDIVMAALHSLPAGTRSDGRRDAIQSAGQKWLEGQGARCGFSVAAPLPTEDGEVLAPLLRIDGYRVLRPPRPSNGSQMRIAILDFEGVLTVTDPSIFLASMARGFGRAKAFGCGLMLISRI